VPGDTRPGEAPVLGRNGFYVWRDFAGLMVARRSAARPAVRRAPGRKPAAGTRAQGRRPGDPRPDKGDGEAAVRARIAKLPQGSRAMVAKIHSILRKRAPDLAPTVKWGHLVYLRNGKMVLYVAGHTKHARFGRMAKGMPSVEFRDVGEVNERSVAGVLRDVPR